MAGGRNFHRFDALNLATNGLATYQITGLLPLAKVYRPAHIVVMAGTNDAIRGSVDRVEIKEQWTKICSEPNAVVILAPPTRVPTLNERLNVLNDIAKTTCSERQRPVIDLIELAGNDGLLRSIYSSDGVHLSPQGYEKVRMKLRALGM
jgi:lysophospholipase L1-like esterase